MKLSCWSWTCLATNFEAKLNFMKLSSLKQILKIVKLDSISSFLWSWASEVRDIWQIICVAGELSSPKQIHKWAEVASTFFQEVAMMAVKNQIFLLDIMTTPQKQKERFFIPLIQPVGDLRVKWGQKLKAYHYLLLDWTSHQSHDLGG
jgi:hypothetical protein